VAHAVAGLGNPGSEYEGTRHNVGQRVVELLARRVRAPWRRRGRAMVAHGRWSGEPLHLLKPLAFMNESGPVVAAALRDLEVDPAGLILVYDDIDLPLGTVRVRLRGSHGGHRGVRSILETLGTTDVRRIKLGVGRPVHKAHVPDYVLSPFEPDERSVLDTAVCEACERVLQLVERARETDAR
jgi:PTH1 family peptidyl-tRNA hydrolase